MRLVTMAINKRWPVSEQAKSDAIATALAIMQTSEKDRDRIAAAKLLLAAEKQNQDDQIKLTALAIQQRNARLDAIADELGIDPRLIVDASRSSSGGVVGDEEL
jgi:hypothetical protein